MDVKLQLRRKIQTLICNYEQDLIKDLGAACACKRLSKLWRTGIPDLK